MDSENLKNHKRSKRVYRCLLWREGTSELAHISACPICTKYWNELKTLTANLMF